MFLIDKKPCLNIKKCVSYSRKTGYFPKGLTHDFGQKFELSWLCVLIENRLRDDVQGYSEKKISRSTQ